MVKDTLPRIAFDGIRCEQKTDCRRLCESGGIERKRDQWRNRIKLPGKAALRTTADPFP